jgi:hypothetical protein
MTTENSDHNQGHIPAQTVPLDTPKVAIPKEHSISSDLSSIRTFLCLSGGSILYCLSALAIIYGISQTFGTVLLNGKSLSEAIGCFAALNVYELALLSVLIFIVVWRKVTDDAISLVILAALFLIASGAILGTIAYHAPYVCLFIGIGAVIIGLGKLYAMRRFISLKFENPVFAGMGLILIWNFLTSSIMSKSIMAHAATDAGRRIQWLTAWLVLLAGAVLILAAAARRKTAENKNDTTSPFLYTPSMTLIFSLVLLGAAYAHQYAIAYMFVVDHVFGDYIPLIGVISLLLIELIYSRGKLESTSAIIIAFMPLFLTLFAVLNQMVIAPFGFGLELLWYVPVMLALIGLGILWISIRYGLPELRFVVMAYVLGILLTAGFVPRDLETLHWRLAGGALLAIMLVIGINRKNMALCFMSIFAMSIGFASSKNYEHIVHYLRLTPEGTFVGILGLGTLLICLFFGSKTPKLLVIFGAIASSLFFADLLLGESAWSFPLPVLAIVLVCILLWLRNRSIVAIVLLCLPMLAKFYLLGKEISYWRWIILSFLLLFAGAMASAYKGKKNFQKQ